MRSLEVFSNVLTVRFIEKLLDVYLIRLAIALPDALNQPEATLGVQLGQQLSGGDTAASEVLADLGNGIIDIHPAMVIDPLILDRQTHAVKQQPIKQLSIGR